MLARPRFPFVSPSNVPKSRYVASAPEAAMPIKIPKPIWPSMNSATLSLFAEIKYPTMVRIRAHWPNGASDVGERSRTNPPMKPSTTAPVCSSSEIIARRTAK